MPPAERVQWWNRELPPLRAAQEGVADLYHKKELKKATEVAEIAILRLFELTGCLPVALMSDIAEAALAQVC